MERVTRIELARPAWRAGILPLNYTRMEGVAEAGSDIVCSTGAVVPWMQASCEVTKTEREGKEKRSRRERMEK